MHAGNRFPMVVRPSWLCLLAVLMAACCVLLPVSEGRYLPTRADETRKEQIKEILRAMCVVYIDGRYEMLDDVPLIVNIGPLLELSPSSGADERGEFGGSFPYEAVHRVIPETSSLRKRSVLSPSSSMHASQDNLQLPVLH